MWTPDSATVVFGFAKGVEGLEEFGELAYSGQEHWGALFCFVERLISLEWPRPGQSPRRNRSCEDASPT